MSRQKFLSLTAILCLMAAASCTRSETEAPDTGRETSLQVVAAQQSARTWLDSSSDSGVLPVYWSNGDRINVNGAASSPLSVADGAKEASAVFKLKNVEAPYDVVYPASVFKSAASGGKCNISIPATQQWKAGSFGEGAAILCGHGDGPVTLQNVCGAVRVRLSDDDGDIIKSLSISCLGDEAIAGDFTLDYASGALTAAATGRISAITMELPDEGVELTPEGTDFYFTVPAGRYAKGFLIRFDDARKHILRGYWLRESIDEGEGLTVQAGKLVSFPKTAYDPDGREICTPEDWQTFATSYNAGTDDWKEFLCKDGSIRFGADITTTEFTMVNNLKHNVDGCGHTVTLSDQTTPLFRMISGENAKICNLTVAGTNTPDDMDVAAIFTGGILGGAVIENCTNKAVFNIANRSGKSVIAPFTRSLFDGYIINCTNEAPIRASVDISTGDQPITMGGIAATVKPYGDDTALGGPSLIKGCVNKGVVELTLIKLASTTTRPVSAGYGGIIGTVVQGDETNFLRIERCSNEGDVSVRCASDPTGALGLLSGVGGVVGMALVLKAGGTEQVWSKRTNGAVLSDVFDNFDACYFEMNNCSNSGSVYNGLVTNSSSDEPYKCFAGGLIGAVNGTQAKHSQIDSCLNTGSVSAYSGSAYTRSALCTGSGGLAGYAGYVDFTDCISKAAKVGNYNWPNYSSSAGLAYAHLSFKLIRCKLFAEVNLIRATNYSQDNYSLGFGLSSKAISQGGTKANILELEGSEITDCAFGGSIVLSTNIVTYSAKTGWGAPVTTNITASNFDQFIASPSAKADFYYHNSTYYLDYKILDKVPITGCTYWDGQL